MLATADLSHPPPLGAFLRSFDGLTSTARAKAVTDSLPVTSLPELRNRLDLVPQLLAAMQAQAAPTPPSKLGPIGKEHLHHTLDQAYTVDGAHWYKKVDVAVGGVPWVVEVMVAQTAAPARFHWLVNHTPVLADPLSKTWLSAGQVSCFGLAGLFGKAGVQPDAGEAVVVSLVCPAPRFTDRGKTTMIVPPAVANAAAGAVWSTAKVIYRGWLAQLRNAQRATRPHRQPTRRVSLRQAVFAALPAAYQAATGGRLPTSCRNLFYKVRPLIQQQVAKELTYDYFTALLDDYHRQHPGVFPLLFYKPRGLLIEPHTEITVPLGTREVDAYQPPFWLYDKILYVEKEGLKETLAYVNFAERYDIAVVYGEGFAPEAARSLVGQLQHDRDYQVFVLHDADLDGYLIADTFAAETTRMPDHHIEVVDLGLTVAQATARGMPVEYRERHKALPDRLTLTAEERAWFAGVRIAGRDKPTWRCQRVELNEFSAPELVAFLEARLADVGADRKVIPPDDVLAAQAQAEHRRQLTQLVREQIADLIDEDAIVDDLVDFVPLPQDGLAATVTAAYAQDRAQRWTAALANRQAAELADNQANIRARVQERFAVQLADALGGAA